MEIALIRAPEGASAAEVVIRGRSPFAGAKVAELSPRLAQRLGLRADTTGVTVVDIDRDSPAAGFGLAAEGHRARGQRRGNQHGRQAEGGGRAADALVEVHRRARRPDCCGRCCATDGRSVWRGRAEKAAAGPAAGRPAAAEEPRRGRRPGASDGRRRRADAHDPLRLARLDDLLGAARHRKDDGGAAARRRDRAAFRADLGGLLRCRRPEEGVRGGAAAPHQRPADAALRRRDPPLQPGAAGFVSSCHGRRHRRPGRRDDREPVLRAQCRVALPRPGAGLPHARRGEPGKAARPGRGGRRKKPAARRRGEGGAPAHGRWRRARRADAGRRGLARREARARSSMPTRCSGSCSAARRSTTRARTATTI